MLSVAVAGKGGVGKTALAALLVRAFRREGLRPVLAVDADPNSNLAEALGQERSRTLADIREELSAPEGSAQSGAGRARILRDEIARSVVEADGFDLITMGRPEGPRCYCYVNSLLRQALEELSRNYAAVVIDNEAGMEHLSRRTTNNVDWLLVVTDTSLPALRAAGRIVELSRQLPISIGGRALVVNKVASEGLKGEFERALGGLSALGVERLADVPHDEALERAGMDGQDVLILPDDAPAVAAVGSLARILIERKGNGRGGSKRS